VTEQSFVLLDRSTASDVS